MEGILEKINIFNKKNITTRYYIFISIFIIGLAFFLNSNKILNKNYDVITTELNTPMTYGNLVVKITDREFNEDTKLAKFTLKIIDKSVDETVLKTELVEKNNVTKLIPTELIKVTKENYVVYAILPKEWTAVSLKIKEDREGNSNNNSIKIYSDFRDISINNSLEKKDEYNLKLESIDQEIAETKDKIAEVNNSILEKKSKIDKDRYKLGDLEKEKEYQTEAEIMTTNSTMEGINTSIKNMNSEVEKLEKQLNEYNDKIKKLQEKSLDLMQQVH